MAVYSWYIHSKVQNINSFFELIVWNYFWFWAINNVVPSGIWTWVWAGLLSLLSNHSATMAGYLTCLFLIKNINLVKYLFFVISKYFWHIKQIYANPSKLNTREHLFVPPRKQEKKFNWTIYLDYERVNIWLPDTQNQDSSECRNLIINFINFSKSFIIITTVNPYQLNSIPHNTCFCILWTNLQTFTTK